MSNSKEFKCKFTEKLQKKYPFIKITKSDQDVRCKCGAEFNIAKNGGYEIERHINGKRHTTRNNNIESNASRKSKHGIQL